MDLRYSMYRPMTAAQVGQQANATPPQYSYAPTQAQMNAGDAEPAHPIVRTFDGRQWHYGYGPPVYRQAQHTGPGEHQNANVPANPPPAIIATPTPAGGVRTGHEGQFRRPTPRSHALPIRAPPAQGQAPQAAASALPASNEEFPSLPSQARGSRSPRRHVSFPQPTATDGYTPSAFFTAPRESSGSQNPE
jgi:hypothetical protein